MKRRLFFSFIFLGKVAIATLLPLAVFAVAGRFIDLKLHTDPWFFVVGAVLSLFATLLWLRSLSKRMITQMNNLD